MRALTALALAGVAALTTLAATRPQQAPVRDDATPQEAMPMELGNFSVSLTVKDIHASKAFYEKLGFTEVGGVLEQNWIVLQNGTTNIGLFQGMFPRNMLTFNPGWSKEKKALDDFQDVRELQALVKQRGLSPEPEADPDGTAPAYFMLADPDGNPILVDQHVPAPKR